MANKSSFSIRSLPAWNFTEYLLARTVSGLLNILPISISTGIVRGAGSLLYWILPSRRNVVLSNLNAAYGNHIGHDEKKEIAKETFRNLATSLMEFFRIPSMLSEAKERFEFEGAEYMDQAFRKGNGVIFAISHIGSWEYLAFLPYLREYPCSVIVRPIKNRYVYEWIQKLRAATRLKPIDRANSIKQILKLLKNNELVAILMDQWAGHDGIWIDFFETPTSTTSIPARLGKRTGAAIIPGYCLRTTPGNYKIVIRPEVPIPSNENYEREVTETLNKLLESEIRKHPSQWAWAHKRWKSIERHL